MTPAGAGKSMIGRLADESELRALAARFTDAVNRRDLAEFRDAWHPDGIWDLAMIGKAEGADAIVALAGDLLGAWELFVQMTHTGVITLDGDRAGMRWVMEEIGRSAEGLGAHNRGFYLDEAVRCEDGRWRFRCRTYQFLHLDDSPVPGIAVATEKAGTAGALPPQAGRPAALMSSETGKR